MTVETKRYTTRVFDDIIRAYTTGKRRILLEGGTYSSKTYSALQALMYIASVCTEELAIHIVSESLPHMKLGAMKDFFNILGEIKEDNPYFRVTGSEYKRPAWKATFTFMGADSEGKAIGPRRDILYINEGNHIPWETARHMDTRTEMFTIVDWNPTSSFWAHEFWKDDPRNDYSHSTYEDARGVLSKEKIEDIEAYKDKDPNWWRIYGLGLLGKLTGLVYQDKLVQVDELPEGEYFYGLDFGFKVDPTVLTKHVIIGDNLYSEEVFYEEPIGDEGLTSDQIARKMALAGIKNEPIYADPSQPTTIKEIRNEGFDIQEAVKGKGSVAFGIQKVNQYYQYWTKQSVRCIEEQRNHRYIMKKDPDTGENHLSDDTTHRWSHGMDSRRYGVASHVFSRGKIKSRHSMRV